MAVFPCASLAFVGGMLTGSFVGVVAHRVPRGLLDRRTSLGVRLLRRADRRLRQRPGALLAAAARSLPHLRRARSRPATRSWSSPSALPSPLRRSFCATTRPQLALGLRLRRDARGDHPDRPRAADHSQHDPARRRGRGRRSRRDHRPVEPSGAGDRRRRRRRAAARLRAGLSARNGDGRREAGGGDGPLPRERRGAGDSWSPYWRGRSWALAC